MDSEKLPLRQAFFGLIFAALFVVVGAIAVSASYGNEGGAGHGSEYGEEEDHGEEKDDHAEEGDHADEEDHGEEEDHDG